MRASRLLSILIMLQLRGRLSAEALAQEFEVSVRTIYRDIDQLSAAGVPVYAERGRSGGFALADGYRTKLTGFTQAEADSLAFAGAETAAADLGLGPDLASARLKLFASLPTESGASAQSVAQRFHLDPLAWYGAAEPPHHLPVLARAVWSRQRIRVRYESWKAVVRRDLDPLGLVLKGGLWYLVASAQRAAPRTYRASAIQSLELLPAHFTRPRGFDLARYWNAWARDFEARLLSGRAVIEASPKGMRLLRDAFPRVAQAAAAKPARVCAEGWTRAEIPVESVDAAALQLLRLGAEVRVIRPPALARAIAAEAERVSALYRRRRPD